MFCSLPFFHHQALTGCSINVGLLVLALLSLTASDAHRLSSQAPARGGEGEGPSRWVGGEGRSWKSRSLKLKGRICLEGLLLLPGETVGGLDCQTVSIRTTVNNI